MIRIELSFIQAVLIVGIAIAVWGAAVGSNNGIGIGVATGCGAAFYAATKWFCGD